MDTGVPAAGISSMFPMKLPAAKPTGLIDTLTVAPVADADSHAAEEEIENAGPATTTLCGVGIEPPCVY
jgi:hypothetical protein